MTFLNMVLLGGLAAAALPVIIHLLNRRKARVIEWGAMRFLELSVASRGRRVLLEEMILLALRTIMLAALVTAMARPLLVNPHFAGSPGANQDVVILLDGSMSMGMLPPGGDDGDETPPAPANPAEPADSPGAGGAPGGETYFDLAKRAAGRAIAQLPAGDAVAVVLAGADPRPLTEGLTFDRPAAARAVNAAACTSGALNVPESLSMACRILQAGRNAHKQVVLITDGRAYGWRVSSADDWQALAGRMAACRPSPRVQVLELARGRERPDERGAAESLLNLSISRIEQSRPVVGTDLPVVFKVTVANTGQRDSPEGVRLLSRVLPDGEPIPPQTIPRLAPLAEATVQLQVHFARPGPYRLAFQLDLADSLPADNARVYALDVLRALPVLLVNGEPAAVSDRDECFWLQMAFHPPPGSRDEQPIEFLVTPTVIEPSRLADEDLGRYYAVVLANVSSLEAASPAGAGKAAPLDKLRAFVESGGGLLIAPGGKADRGFYNGAMFQDGNGLLPAKLGEPVDVVLPELSGRAARPAGADSPSTDRPSETVAAEAASALGPPPQGHPALVHSAQAALWPAVRVFRRYPLLPPTGRQVATVLQLALPADAEGGGTQTVEYAVEKAFGRGRVILLGGPLDIDWGNLPLRKGYAILVNELTYHLSAPRRTALNLERGQMFLATLPPDQSDVAAEVRTPAGQTVPLIRRLEGGRWVFPFSQTAEPGVYEARFSGRGVIGRKEGADPTVASGPPDVLYFTVQPDGAEASTTLLNNDSRDRVRRTLAGGIRFCAHPAELYDALRVTDPGREIWKWLAAGVLALLVAEVWLTRRITRHRQGQAGLGIQFGQGPVHTIR